MRIPVCWASGDVGTRAPLHIFTKIVTALTVQMREAQDSASQSASRESMSSHSFSASKTSLDDTGRLRAGSLVSLDEDQEEEPAPPPPRLSSRRSDTGAQPPQPPAPKKQSPKQREPVTLLREGSDGLRARWEETAQRLQELLQPIPAQPACDAPNSPDEPPTSPRPNLPKQSVSEEPGRLTEQRGAGPLGMFKLSWRAKPKAAAADTGPRTAVEGEGVAADKSEEYFQLVEELLTQLPCPLLLVVDDVHVIDSLSYTLLLRLCGRMPRGCLLLCTCEEADSPEVSALRAEAHHHLPLPPLSDQEVHLLARELLEAEALPGALQKLFASLAQGSPYFCEEIATFLRSDKKLLKIENGVIELLVEEESLQKA
eukprot:4447038-Prymnesium_polylepis.1